MVRDTQRTSGSVTQLDQVERAATYRAAVGAFDPWLQAVIMQDMTTRKQVSNLIGGILTAI